MSELFKFSPKVLWVYTLILAMGSGILLGGGVYSKAAAADEAAANKDVATQVICNVVVFVQKLGLPIMTGVILGSSVMAVFGRLAWPAIAALVVFTAIFFGASKLVSKFALGISDLKADSFECKEGKKTS